MITITTCRTQGCKAPETADHATLHRTTGEGLLTAYASLTRRMQRQHDAGAFQESQAARAQRDLIEAEVLRRMGDQR